MTHSGKVDIAMEKGPGLKMYSVLKMVIFHCYVSLPEGSFLGVQRFLFLILTALHGELIQSVFLLDGLEPPTMINYVHVVALV